MKGSLALGRQVSCKLASWLRFPGGRAEDTILAFRLVILDWGSLIGQAFCQFYGLHLQVKLV